MILCRIQLPTGDFSNLLSYQRIHCSKYLKAGTLIHYNKLYFIHEGSCILSLSVGQDLLSEPKAQHKISPTFTTCFLTLSEWVNSISITCTCNCTYLTFEIH